jgi:hypothetical protein
MTRTAIAILAVGLIASSAKSEPLKNMTNRNDWTFRVRWGADLGDWKPTLASAVASCDVSAPSSSWPGKWRTFVAWEPNDATVETLAPAQLSDVPTTLTLGGISACRATLPLYTGGVLDLTIGHGAPWEGRWAWTFGAMKTARDETVVLAIESAGPVTVWVDSRKVIQAKAAGQHSAKVTLAKGTHVVAARVTSGSKRWFLQGRVVPVGQPVVETRCRFTADDPSRFASVTIVGQGSDEAVLNKKTLSRPLPGMIGPRLRGVSTELLKDGENVLERSIPLWKARRMVSDKNDGTLQVLGVRPGDASIVMGPILSARGKGLHLAVVADANVPATLTIDGRTLESPSGVFHRWELEGLKPATEYEYRVTVGKGQTQRSTLRTLPAPGRPTSVAIVGDPQSGKAWKTVSAALRKRRPDLVIIAGDLVVDGLLEQQWQETFLQPAAKLLAEVPFRVIPGNHDRYSPLQEAFFGDGQPGEHWSQPLGGGLLVGIDGGDDFSSGGPSSEWLTRTLSKAETPLVFVVSHYPAYSSRNHGKLAHDGRVLEWTSRQGRNRIVPLLEKHDVAGLFGGHDHGYERSELPGGLSAIVTGGGGAGTYPKRKDAGKQNPYSKAFGTEHHYSLLTIAPDAATLRVLTPTGKELDKRTWSANSKKETDS